MERRAHIIEATLRLLADRPFDRVTLRAIAREADVSLSALAAEFATRGEILAAYGRRVDEAVLAASFDDMADQPPRDRVFDVLMTRLDVLGAHKDAIASLLQSARRDPSLAFFLNAQQRTSMRWMLEAAAITPTGWQGRAAVQALSIAFAKVLRVFVKEEDPGLPRTMAALDKELRSAEALYLRLARFVGSGLSAEPAAAATEAAPASAPPAAEAAAGGTGDDGAADDAVVAHAAGDEAPVTEPPLDPDAKSADDGAPPANEDAS